MQQSQPGVFAKHPEYLYVLPNPDPSLLTLITTPPLMSIDLSPLSFFEAQSDGFRINSTVSERIEEEDSEIIRFIRTPEGSGVGAVRMRGGECWRTTKRGTRIVRSGTWDKADFVVVLDCGMSYFFFQPCWSVVYLTV